MIYELKKKMDRLGAVIAYFDHEADSPANIETLNAMVRIASAVDIHHIGTSFEKEFGVNWIGHKTVPAAKKLVGHHIAQFRGGDGIIVFVKANTLLAPNVEELYKFVGANRMERAFGFHVGPLNDPVAVGLASPLMEHLFHSMPDQMKVDDSLVRWIHGWAGKTLMGGRYFDATDILGVPTTKETPVVSEAFVVQKKDTTEGQRAERDFAAPKADDPIPAKRRPGRPKKNLQ